MKIPAVYSRKKARIEIIPLIDIVFFLLATFVMVSMSMVKNQSISVHLPKAATAKSADQVQSITLSVNKSGDYFVNKEPVAESMLSQRLQMIKTHSPDAQVWINADEEAPFGLAIRLLDEARKQGIQKVSIRTRGVQSS